VRIGHINLADPVDDSAGHLISLVEALQETGVRQHVLVRNESLATRIAAISGVDVGPVVQVPVMAYCLLPRVHVAHVHEPAAGQAGLLLALTKSIPYVLTHRGQVEAGQSPLIRSIYRRASLVICQDDSEVALLQHWLPGLAVDIVPELDRERSAALHLSAYQNCQRIPMAGSNGSQ
jgi:hypothetical protein